MSFCDAQIFDIIIKNGHVIDPKNDLDSKLDIGITDGIIKKISNNIPTSSSKKIIDVSGMYVVPGLIDIHTHVFVGDVPNFFANGRNSVAADNFSFRSGITTMVDAGTSGWRNFPVFKKNVIEKSNTRILVFLNIAGNGMSGNPILTGLVDEKYLEKITSDKKYNQQSLLDMDANKTASVINHNKDVIIGVKIGHYEGEGIKPFEIAIEAANIANVPIIVECHLPKISLKNQLRMMRPGDILSHSFENVEERETVIDENGKVREYVIKAKEKGVLFDVSHGGYGFWFDQALPALEKGFKPDTFGTDLHKFSMNKGMKSMLNIMSKYLNMGMSINDVVLRATWNPAKSIKRDDLGSLTIGNEADISILSLISGDFGFVDAAGFKITGDKKLQAELTIREGVVQWDLNGLSAKIFR
ncbi:MAG: amidohydrolase/deacetylase family metallohydrolase [Flavobacteriaceae bacterium]|nr:amidohydrolase/deacetylase family metallohydrolase [Flavobacteriaceae bacterium]